MGVAKRKGKKMFVLTGMAVIKGTTSNFLQLALLPETKIRNKILDYFSLSACKKFTALIVQDRRRKRYFFYNGATAPQWVKASPLEDM